MASKGPEPFFASAGFKEILLAAGLDIDLDAFILLEEARQLVLDGEMDAAEYEQLAKGLQMQLLQLAMGGSIRALTANQAQGRPEPKPTTVEIPTNEKPLIEGWLLKQPVNASNPLQRQFKKRYVVLYKTCVIYYANKGDKQAKGRVDLTPDFFVQDSSAHKFGFVVSDMTTTITLAADTEELKQYWVHMCAMVLRKLTEGEHPVNIQINGDNTSDEASRIQKQFEERLTRYKEDKANRRSSFMPFARKKANKEDFAKEGEEYALQQTAKELKEKELQRQKELEELQRRLDAAEAEKNKYKTEAEAEHLRADEEQAKAAAEALRRQDAEARLQKTLDELRAESRMREEVLLQEREEIEKKLLDAEARFTKRRQSMMPGTQLPSQEQEAWEKERMALQAKLNALQDALNVDLGSLDWDGTLEDAENKMKALIPALCSEDEKEQRKAQAEFDQWDKLIRNHSEYKQREEQKWTTWENDNAPKNQRALDEMKRIVPHEVTSGISLEFLVNQCHLSNEVAQRIVKTKIFQFYYMEPPQIAKIHIADLASRYVPQGLDIRELRAVYACLPKEFELDSDGRKKLWRDDCRAKLKAFTEKEAANTLGKFEQMAAAYRPKEVGGKGGGSSAPAHPMAGGKNPAAGALGALFAGRGGPPGDSKKLDTSALQSALASKLAGGAGGGIGGPPKNPKLLAMLQKSSEEANKEEKAKETNDLLSMVKARKTTNTPAESSADAAKMASAAAPSKAAAEAKAPPATTTQTKKVSIVDSKPAPDLGYSFNKPAPKGAESGPLIGTDAADIFHKATHRSLTITEDEFEGDVPAYDFEASYGAASKRKTWVDDGISKLITIIEENGKPDPKEGNKVTATFGVVFEKFGDGSDMLVGILMRARKKNKIKYVGDMLFKGVHDAVKISIV